MAHVTKDRKDGPLRRGTNAYIYRLLKAYRETHGLTQQQVADRLQLSRTYISLIERGVANNLSFDVAQRILNLGDESHGQIMVTLTHRVMIDATIAAEIVWLNSQNVLTIGSCAGPPLTAMITPRSSAVARRLGYNPEYYKDVGLFEIALKSEIIHY